jgi:hypothetical protein
VVAGIVIETVAVVAAEEGVAETTIATVVQVEAVTSHYPANVADLAMTAMGLVMEVVVVVVCA